MKITPELIPHSHFQNGIWLLPVNGSNWYYFLKKKNTNTISNNDFIESVDGPLKELVKFLHRKKIKTTPSCAGHHLGTNNLKNKYKGLYEDGKHIKNGGLQLMDIQNRKLYNYQDKNYQLPWNKEEFVTELRSYQQKGIIGLRLGNRKTVKEKLLKLKIEGVSVTEKDKILFISINETSREKNKKKWKEITKAVKESLK